MNKMRFFKENKRPFFTVEDISRWFRISIPSARVFCSRKVQSGELLRARRDLYISSDAFREWKERDFYILANTIQTPSYVSLGTALSYYGLTTQWISTRFESMNPVRSCTYEVDGISFAYHFSRSNNYFDYEKKEGFFIASPEKALLDSLYLLSLRKYALDEHALDLKTIRWARIQKGLKGYSGRFRKFFMNWRESYASLSKT